MICNASNSKHNDWRRASASMGWRVHCERVRAPAALHVTGRPPRSPKPSTTRHGPHLPRRRAPTPRGIRQTIDRHSRTHTSTSNQGRHSEASPERAIPSAVDVSPRKRQTRRLRGHSPADERISRSTGSAPATKTTARRHCSARSPTQPPGGSEGFRASCT